MPTWSQTGQKRLTGGSFVTPVKAFGSLSLHPFGGSLCQIDSLCLAVLSVPKRFIQSGRYDNLPMTEVHG